MTVVLLLQDMAVGRGLAGVDHPLVMRGQVAAVTRLGAPFLHRDLTLLCLQARGLAVGELAGTRAGIDPPLLIGLAEVDDRRGLRNRA